MVNIENAFYASPIDHSPFTIHHSYISFLQFTHCMVGCAGGEGHIG
jgi:hypothetical protein